MSCSRGVRFRSGGAAGDLRTHGRAAGLDFGDGTEDFGDAGVFQNIADGSGLERMEDAVVFAVDGDDDDLRGGQKLVEAAGGLDAGDAGQVEVHENDVRSERREFCVGGFTAGAAGDAFQVRGPRDDTAQRGGELRIVFDEGNADGNGHGENFPPVAKLKLMRQPSPGLL